jgi:hypothetical protein
MNDLEFLRDLFKDPRLHIGIGLVTDLGLSQDGSILRASVMLQPENREIVAEVTFSDVNSVTFPEIQDLVLVLFVDGHPDEAFVVARINNSDEPIPVFAQAGNTMIAPRQGKKVGIGRSTVTPTDPMVLGTELMNYLVALESRIEAIINALNTVPTTICTAPGVLGEVNPVLVTDLDTVLSGLQSDKATYLTAASTNILSQIAFTERGV